MTNTEVARAMVCQALDYAEAGDMEAVIQYLTYVEVLLQKPEEENLDHPMQESFEEDKPSSSDLKETE